VTSCQLAPLSSNAAHLCTDKTVVFAAVTSNRWVTAQATAQVTPELSRLRRHLAAERRQDVARGVSPWIASPVDPTAPEGRQERTESSLSPLRGFGVSSRSFQGLTPLATPCRPYGTGEPVEGSLPDCLLQTPWGYKFLVDQVTPQVRDLLLAAETPHTRAEHQVGTMQGWSVTKLYAGRRGWSVTKFVQCCC
jgi:hypothetical protein